MDKDGVYYVVCSHRSNSLEAECEMRICVQVIYWENMLRKTLYGSEGSRLAK